MAAMATGQKIPFYRRIWFWFMGVMLINNLALVIIFLVLGVQKSADSLGRMSFYLVTALQEIELQQGAAVLDSGMAVRLRQNEFLFSREPIGPFPPPPAYLVGIREVIQVIEKLGEGSVRCVFQPGSPQILWVQTTSAPIFAVGMMIAGKRGVIVPLLLTSGFLILVITSFAVWWITRYFSRPLQLLAESTPQLVGTGDTDAPFLQEPSTPEIAALSNAIHTMRNRMTDSMKERELFLAGISHDLRAPLNRLQMASELSEPEAWLLAGMREDIDEMATLLQQTIELARFDMDASEPWVSGDINQLLLDVRDKYQRAGQLLVLDLADLPPVRHKPVALTRLLYNLIDNALKHGNGEVRVASVMLENAPSLVVSNAAGGNEIPNPTLWQLSESGGRSGLGLAIVDRIAKVHDAVFEVREQADGWRVSILRFK